jgi:hypothetical protein
VTALTWPERLRALYRGNRVLSPGLHDELAAHIESLEGDVKRLRRALEWSAALDARESTEGEIRNAIKRAQTALNEETR